MADLKIEDLSIRIAEAVQLAQQLAKRAHLGRTGGDGKNNFQRLGIGLDLARDTLSYLKIELDAEPKRRMLSTTALGSIYEILAVFNAVFRRIEAFENARDDGSIKNKAMENSQAEDMLAQLDKLKCRVLLLSAVMLYAGQIRRGESKSARQKQQKKIQALLYGDISEENAAVLKLDASDSPSPDLAQDPGSLRRSTDLSDFTRTITGMRKTTTVIVGIDFGATSSAVAFALVKGGKQEPKVLDGWPESVRQSIDGVPREQQIQSTVYYDQYLNVVGWGEEKFEAVSSYSGHTRPGRLFYLRPGVQRIQGFKLGLASPGDINLYLPPGKPTADVTVDYLLHLRQSACLQIEDRLSKEMGRAQISLQYVIAVPAFWDEQCQKKLLEVAKMAGFCINADINELALIPGPEAAIIYAESIDPSAFRVGDNILVVDCGGNLVESVTYIVKSKDSLRLERYTSPCVAFCGSAEAMRRFMTTVERKIKKTGLSDHKIMKSRIRPKCRFYFQSQIMLQFGSPNFQPSASIPRGLWAVDVGWEADFPEADIEDGYMMFSEEEIYSCFDPVVDRTLELIGEQVAAVRAQHKDLQVRTDPSSFT